MCLGVPGKIIEITPARPGELASAVVEFDGLRRPVYTAFVPEALPGDYVIVHAGVAISRLDADEAARLLEHLRAMDEFEPGPGDEP
jgi:hydrogenase expression/formation protein HypC